MKKLLNPRRKINITKTDKSRNKIVTHKFAFTNHTHKNHLRVFDPAATVLRNGVASKMLYHDEIIFHRKIFNEQALDKPTYSGTFVCS